MSYATAVLVKANVFSLGKEIPSTDGECFPRKRDIFPLQDRLFLVPFALHKKRADCGGAELCLRVRVARRLAARAEWVGLGLS